MERVRRSDGDTNRDLASLPIMLNMGASNPTYAMKPSDNVVIAISSQADAASIITLPSLAESVGQFYHLKAPTGSTAGDISVYEKETGTELSTYGDMDADNDEMILFSTGVAWVVVLDNVA